MLYLVQVFKMSLRTHVPGSPLKTLQLNNGQINPSINQSITLKDIKVIFL